MVNPASVPSGISPGFRRLLLLVSAVVFVDTIFFTAITPLLPHYAHTLNLSKAGAGILVAAYPAGTLIGSLPAGIFASRLGVRTAVVAGLALMSASTLTFGLSSSATVLDVARFVQGFAGACTWSGALAWLAGGAPPARRAWALGMSFSAAVGGALLGPVLGAVASAVGTAPAFGAATAGGVVLIVASLFVPVAVQTETQRLSRAARSLADPGLSGGVWLTCLAGLSFGIVDVLAPLRLNDLGAGAFVIGAGFFGAAALEGVLAPVIGKVADRKGRSRPAVYSLVGSVVVCLLLPFAAPAAVLVALLVVGLPAFGSLYVPAAAMVADGAGRRGLHQGLAFAMTNLGWAGGQAVAAAGGAALAQATSDLVPYYLLAVAFAATLLALGSLKRSRRLSTRSPL